MKRAALTLSALALTACVFLYLFGAFSVSVLAAILWLASAVCFVLRKAFNLSLQVPLILLIATFLCVYICAYNHYIIKPVENLEGKSGNVTARVIEEPEYQGEYAILTVKTLQQNSDFKGIKLKLILNTQNTAADSKVGDILSTTVKLTHVEGHNKRLYYSNGIYISAFCDNTEISGHQYTPYETAVKIRQSISSVIRNNFTGDTGGLINGVILGDNSGMSDGLLSAFKACGVSHITAVSGLHINIICSAVTSILIPFMKRRKAYLISTIPLIAAVAITGFTPSAVRAGIMSFVTFSGALLLKRTDSLNSLGVAITAMLIYNPFYVLDLGFQLSCSATAGVIIAAKFATPIIEHKINFKYKFWRNIVKSALSVLSISIGASLFTAPFQILTFGSVSIIAPLANIAICAAVTYLLLSSLIAIILSYIPFMGIIAKPIVFIAGLLSDYTSTVIAILAKVQFSTIPIGTDIAILWIGLSLSLIGLWLLFERVGGIRFIAILITALLLISLWSGKLANRNTVKVSSLDVGNGFCTVISRDGEGILIGCGDDSSDANVISTYLTRAGVNKIAAVVIPTDDIRYIGGLNTVSKRYKPKIILTQNSPIESIAAMNDNNRDFLFLDENSLIKTDLADVKLGCCNSNGYSVIKAIIFENTFVIGLLKADFTLTEPIDFIISGTVLSQSISAPIMIISGNRYADNHKYTNSIIFTTHEKTITIKLQNGKEPIVYAKE